MKTLIYPAVLGLTLAFSNLGAQSPADAPEPSREEVENYVKEMGSYIKGREERAAGIVNQIMELDKSLNAAVTGVLDKLKTITDSQDSKTKVTRIKKDVIERIGKAANYYAAERAKLEEALRVTNNTYRREDLYKERKQFDTKIDNMVNAVIDLSLSMDTHQDYEKYLYENSYWNAGVRKNPDYEQNRRSTAQADTARREIGETLQESLDRLKAKENQLAAQLTNTKLSEEQRKILQGELDRVSSIRGERLEQLYAVSSTEQKPTVEVGLRSAMQLEDVIELVAADARRDMTNLFARYRELRAERDAIASQKARLEHAEKWLKEQDAK